MELTKILKISIIFLIGFLSANFTSYYFIYGLENPFSGNLSFNKSNNVPFDFVSEENIKIYEDKVVIYIKGASLSRYAPTGSMEPILDEDSNGIRIIPQSEDEIHIGDIISFKQGSYLIVHRVIDIGSDGEGTYYITKGDNNSINDGKVRFKDIKYITIAIIW